MLTMSRIIKIMMILIKLFNDSLRSPKIADCLPQWEPKISYDNVVFDSAPLFGKSKLLTADRATIAYDPHEHQETSFSILMYILHGFE